jgi:heme/copper-type cytochrome/quinol oxidase subunit 2
MDGKQNNNDNKKKKYELAGVLVVIIGLALIWFYDANFKRVERNPNNQSLEETNTLKDVGYVEKKQTSPDALPTVEGGTRKKIDTQIKTPKEGEKTAENVAAPERVVPIANGISSERTFSLIIDNNKIKPGLIVVNEFDKVVLNLKAVDKDYDFFLPDFGVYKKIEKNTSASLVFQVFGVGKYEIKCRDLCANAVLGNIYVNQRGE